MEELKLIWKHKKFVVIITLIAMLIAGIVNSRTHNKYTMIAYFSLNKYDKEMLLDESRFRSMFVKGLNLEYPIELKAHFDHRYKEENLLKSEVITGEPDKIKKRFEELVDGGINSLRLSEKVTFTDKIFYTLLFSLSVMVVASLFVVVFFCEGKKEEG